MATLPCKDGKIAQLALQRCQGVSNSLLVILNNGNILTFATAVGLTNSNKDFRFVQSQDIGIAFSFWLVLIGIGQIGNLVADLAFYMCNGWLNMLVARDWQALSTSFV